MFVPMKSICKILQAVSRALRGRSTLVRSLPVFLLMAGAVACTRDEVAESGGEGPITFHLKIATADLAPDSRANDINVMTNELMKSWLVIMAKKVDDGSGSTVLKIEAVVENNSIDGEVDEDNVLTFTGDAGERTFFSFANLSRAEILTRFQSAGYGGTNFAVGDVLPALSALNEISYPVSNTGLEPAQTATQPGFSIPMTGVQTDVMVDNNSTETVYVYRVLSRLRFHFTNKCGRDVTIKKITMGDITYDNTAEAPSEIYFFPQRTETGEILARFPAHHAGGNYVFYDQTGEGASPLVLADDASHDFEYYISPSVSLTHDTRHFPIWVEIEGIPGMNPTRYAVTSLDNIRRNAIVTLPITLTGYDMELRAYHYAPIGGYPEVSITKKNDTEFYCTFTGSGDFAMRPFIYKYEDYNKPEKWFDINDERFVKSKTLTVDDPKGIFAVDPHFNGGTEIFGTLNGTKGSAIVKLTAELIISESVTQTYTRVFYVIHE